MSSIAFEGIGAASAGAINAAVFACGLAEGGRGGAKKSALAKLWRRVAHLCSLTPLQPSLADRLLKNHSLELAPFVLFDLVTRLFSPYQLNPFNYNPLRQILTETVDFDALRQRRAHGRHLA